MKKWMFSLFFFLALPMFVSAETSWTVESTQNAILYTSPDANSSPAAQLSEPVQLPATGYKNGYYTVTYNGVVSYLSTSEARSLFDYSIAAFQVADQAIPYYNLKHGDLFRRGMLEPGTVVKRSGSSAGYHSIVYNGMEYFVPEQGTIPVFTAAPVDFQGKAVYTYRMLPEKEAIVTNSSGKPIGTLTRGQFVQLLDQQNGKGKINFLSQEGWVALSDFVHSDYFNPKKNLSHAELNYFLRTLHGMYPEFTELKRIGYSVEGREILAFKLGTSSKEVLMDASLHAREHMTSNVLAEMIDTYSYHYVNNSVYAGYNARNAFNKASVWFVPMVNPDGVTLVQGGASAVKNGALATRINGGSTNFNRWKSNVRGVDLNDNFASRWETIRGGNTKPAYMAYKGPAPFSEPEAKALKDFMKSRSFESYISYHSSGQIMYWFNYQASNEYKRDLGLARSLSTITGYKVMPPQYLPGSGASADYFIQETKKPGITLEISTFVGERPVPLANWDRIWKQNSKVGLYLAVEAFSRK